MKLSFVSLTATDKIWLPALLYEPTGPTKKAAIWLHGMGDNGIFYKPHFINPLGQSLADRGITLLALNNRGAHNSKSLKIADITLPEEDRQYPGGTHYELIEDCVKDINGAVNFLQQKRYSEFYLLGHSTGANKICAYHVRTKINPFAKYVLAGPGDDVGTTFCELGSKKFWQALKYAAKSLTEENPLKIMPRYSGMYPFSAQSAHDIMDPDGAYNTFPFYEDRTERLGKKPLFEEYKHIDRPTLVIMGENDQYAYTADDAKGAIDIFIKYTPNKMLKKIDFQLVSNTDHSFHESEADFAQRVSEWLA